MGVARKAENDKIVRLLGNRYTVTRGMRDRVHEVSRAMRTLTGALSPITRTSHRASVPLRVTRSTSHKAPEPLRYVVTPSTKLQGPPFVCDLDDDFHPTTLMHRCFLVEAYARMTPVAYALCELRKDSLHVHLLCNNPAKYVKNAVVGLIHVLEDMALRRNRKLLTLESLKTSFTFYYRLGFRRSANACARDDVDGRLRQYVSKHHKFYARPRTQKEIDKQKLYGHASLPENSGFLYLSKCMKRASPRLRARTRARTSS